MNIIKSTVFRSLCSIAVGTMLIKNPSDIARGIVVAIGILFVVSGVIAFANYFYQCNKLNQPQADEVDSQKIEQKPTFPISGTGSFVLGCILSLMPDTFTKWLFYVLGALLIIAAFGQFVSLFAARKHAIVPISMWIPPVAIFLSGVFVVVKPMEAAELPLQICGWCFLLYGIVELLYAIRDYRFKREYEKAIQQDSSLSDDSSSKHQALESGEDTTPQGEDIN